jgi:hypothetical protein
MSNLTIEPPEVTEPRVRTAVASSQVAARSGGDWLKWALPLGVAALFLIAWHLAVRATGE